MAGYKIRMVRANTFSGRARRLRDGVKKKLSAPRLIFIPRHKILQGIYSHYRIEQASWEEDMDSEMILRFVTPDRTLALKLRRGAREFVEMYSERGNYIDHLILISSPKTIEQLYLGKL